MSIWFISYKKKITQYISDIKGKSCTVLCHHHLAWGLWWHTVQCLRPPSGVNDLQSVNQRQTASTSSLTSSSSNSHQHHKKSSINALGEHDHRLSQDWRTSSSSSMSCTSCSSLSVVIISWEHEQASSLHCRVEWRGVTNLRQSHHSANSTLLYSTPQQLLLDLLSSSYPFNHHHPFAYASAS